MKHDSCGRIAVLVEEALQHVHYELHRRVVVIEQEHSIHVGPLDLRPGLGDDRASRHAGQARVAAAAFAIIVSHPGLQACRPNFVLVHGRVGRPSHRRVSYRHRSGMSTAQGIMPPGGTKRNAERNNKHGRGTVPDWAELDVADVRIRPQFHRGSKPPKKAAAVCAGTNALELLDQVLKTESRKMLRRLTSRLHLDLEAGSGKHVRRRGGAQSCRPPPRSRHSALPVNAAYRCGCLQAAIPILRSAAAIPGCAASAARLTGPRQTGRVPNPRVRARAGRGRTAPRASYRSAE